VFSRTVPQDGRISIAEGYFDAVKVEDGWADLVVIAQVRIGNIDKRVVFLISFQAFHWCPDYDAAAAEFSRILKPTGSVALIWNLEDRYESPCFGTWRILSLN